MAVAFRSSALAAVAKGARGACVAACAEDADRTTVGGGRKAMRGGAGRRRRRAGGRARAWRRAEELQQRYRKRRLPPVYDECESVASRKAAGWLASRAHTCTARKYLLVYSAIYKLYVTCQCASHHALSLRSQICRNEQFPNLFLTRNLSRPIAPLQSKIVVV